SIDRLSTGTRFNSRDRERTMTESTATTGFSPEALDELAREGSRAQSSATRRQAFDAFQAMPTPSPDTEEWRYTDLRELDLSFVPFAAEAPVTNLDEVRPEILEAAGEVGERAGLSIQHNSTVVISNLNPDAAARGVVFTSLDWAEGHH